MATKRNAAIGFIFITLLIDVIGFGIIIPVMPKLISELKQVDISTAAKYGSYLTVAYAITQFLFAPILGNLSDKYGRRPVLLFSLFGFGIDYIFLALAPTYGWLFIGRIIAGITGCKFYNRRSIYCRYQHRREPGKKFWNDRRCIWTRFYHWPHYWVVLLE